MHTLIIQARTGSTRLPGKVLKRVCGKTLLEHLILRAARSRKVGKIIVATTGKKQDEAIDRIAQKCNAACFRGSETDVLDRYYHAAKGAQANTIVRVTGDCPLIDPGIIDEVAVFFDSGGYEYVSNTNPSTFPDGMDVEVCSFGALERTWREARAPIEREHVTAYIRSNPRLFTQGNVRYKADLSRLRLTLDYEKDLLRIRRIFKALYPGNPHFSLEDILHFLRATELLDGIEI